MASIDWPVTIPQAFIQNTFSESPDSGVIRTNMEVGPAKVRRRTTAVNTVWKGSMVMTYAELLTFKNWFKNTAKLGSLAFNFPDQYDLVSTVEARFIIDTGGKPYNISPDGETQDFMVNFNLEVFV
jgi:hypothetical protein